MAAMPPIDTAPARRLASICAAYMTG